jgi:hypothetical protein
MDAFEKIKSKRKQLPEQDSSQGRTIAYSQSTTSRLMEVLDANALGNVHGGVIMRMVDEAAAIVAIKHARRSVVTSSYGCNLRSRQGISRFPLKTAYPGSLNLAPPSRVSPRASHLTYWLERLSLSMSVGTKHVKYPPVRRLDTDTQ